MTMFLGCMSKKNVFSLAAFGTLPLTFKDLDVIAMLPLANSSTKRNYLHSFVKAVLNKRKKLYLEICEK